METICLSPVPALRCVGLSLVEESISLIPAALEVIFSLGLIFAGYDAGITRYLLVLEGPVYLLLVLLSLLDRVIPVFQNSLEAHKLLDIIIGSASFIPILLYTFHLYLFKRKEFFPQLPKRFALVASAFALTVIPVIIVTNEIGSFLGVRYRHVPGPENRVVGNQIAIGPDSTSLQFGREFLKSTSLALLFVYQTITLLVFLMRLISCILAQRAIEHRAAAEREGILFRGIGWLVVGMMISAIESTTGFTSTSFGIVLMRRILRMLGRACIIIGVVKGPDCKEEFLILDSDKDNEFISGTRKLRASGTRFYISSPRLVQTSMTRRFSRMIFLQPSRATFTSRPPLSPSMSVSELTHFTPRPSNDSPLGWPSVAAAKPRPSPLANGHLSVGSHMSAVHGPGTPPTLVLNLSPFNLPNGDMLAEMSANRTSKSTLDYIRVGPRPRSSLAWYSAPTPWVTDPPSYIPSRSPEEDIDPRPTQSRERSPRWSSSWHRSMPPAAPRIPINISLTPASASRQSYQRPLTAPEAYGSTLRPAQGSDGGPAQRSAEALRLSSRSQSMRSWATVSGISTDWIVPEGEAEGEGGGGRLMHIRSIGSAPHRTTPTPTSAGAVRGSVVLERHESVAGTTPMRERARSRRETVRRDSGVLCMDDLALVPRSSPGTPC